MKNKLILTSVLLLLSTFLLTSTVASNGAPITEKDNIAKQQIFNRTGNAVENHYDRINNVWINASGSIVQVYNKSEISIPPPPPPPVCPPGTHLENGVCVPDVVTPPTGLAILQFVGDVECGSAATTLISAMKGKNPTRVFNLGDLCYDSSLSSYKSKWIAAFPSIIRCTIGNHDAPEDGSSSIYTEAKNLCGQYWRYKTAFTVTIGTNTNGDLTTSGNQFKTISSWLTNATYMKGVKNVIFTSHKPAYNIPNAHHPVESKVKTFFDALSSQVPTGVKKYYIAAHDHIMAQTTDNTKFVSGAGTRSHYDCNTSTTWNFCNDTSWGFLQLAISKSTGAITPHFYNSAGSQIH